MNRKIEILFESGIKYSYYKDGAETVYHSSVGPAVSHPSNSYLKFYFWEGEHVTFDKWFSLLSHSEKIEAMYNEENFE